MFKFGELKRLVEDFKYVADFLVIYIEEAHASGKNMVAIICVGHV